MSPSRDPGAELRAFLDGPSKPAGALGYLEAHGFLFTVAAGPDLVQPSEWLPMILGEGEPPFANQAQAERVLGALLELYNELIEQTTEHRVRPPRQLQFRDDVLANLEHDAPVSQWSRGFHRGHCWLEESWPEGVADFEDELGACLFTLSFFSSRELAEGFVKECARDGQSLAEVAESSQRLFPDAMISYALLGEACRNAAREMAKASAGREARRSRVGRNDPCPCGSGKKYKKCCLATDTHVHGPDCAHEHDHVHGPGCDHGPHGH
jgi:uncharacterized protein